MSQTTGPARAYGPPPRAPRRGPWTALAAVIVALAVTAVVVVFVRTWPESTATPTPSGPETSAEPPASEPVPDPTPTSDVADGSSPTPTASLPVTLTVAVGVTPASATLASVAGEAARAAGVRVEYATAGGDTLDGLAAGTIAFAPVYAATLLSLENPGDPPPDDVTGSLPALLGSDIGFVETGLDGRLVWATRGVLTTWTDIPESAVPLKAVIPSLAETRWDGRSGVAAAYQENLEWSVDDDTVARSSKLVTGEADVAAFRATDVAELGTWATLPDDAGLSRADPVVVLVSQALRDERPAVVEAVARAFQVLGADGFRDLETEVAKGADAEGVAARWVAENL